MSNTVDNRVVEMQFNNNQFEKGIHSSLLSLEKFKQGLSFKGADAGLNQLQKNVNSLSFANIENALLSLEQRFSTLGIVGMTAIQNITNRVVDLGLSIGKNVINQIKQGGITRYQNIANAKFQIEGLGAAWEDLYKDMDYAVDGTAYGIDEAAKVASSLSASGMEAGDAMKKSLRAVSGVAAMTNSTYSEIGDIFTTIAGNGKLMTMQMQQLSFRGLNVAATLGKQLGYTEQQIREMVTKGEIDFQTFAEAMDDAFGEHAKKANNTFNGALANMKSALSRIGENFARPIFEGMIKPLNALREVINEVKNRLAVFTGSLTNNSWKTSPFGAFIKDLSLKATYLIRTFKDSGSLNFINVLAHRLSIMAQIGSEILYSKDNIFDTIINFLKNSKKVTSDDLTTYPLLIKFFEGLKKIGQALKNVFTSIVGVFKAVFEAFTNVFKIGDAANGLNSFADVLLKISEASKFTEYDGRRLIPILTKIFAAIKTVIGIIGKAISFIVDKVVPLFRPIFNFLIKIANKIIDITTDAVNFVEKNKLIEKALNSLKNILSKVGNGFNIFKGGLSKVVEYLKNIEPKKWGILIAGIILVRSLYYVNLFLKGMAKVQFAAKSFLSIPTKIALALRSIAKFAQYMGISLMIQEIAIAILALAASLAILTLVDPAKLITATKCLASLIAVIGVFTVVMTLIAKSIKDTSQVNKYLLSLATTFLFISVSVLLLANALKVISSINDEKVWKSFGVLSAVIGELVVAVVLLSWLAPQLSAGSSTIIVFSASIWLLVKSLQSLDGVNTKEVIEKLTILLISLLAIVKITELVTATITAKQVGGIIGIILAIVLMEHALKYIVQEGVNYRELLNNIDKLLIVFGSLLALTYILNKVSAITDSFTGAKSILVMVLSIYILTKSLNALAKIDSNKMGQALKAYIVIMLSLIALVKVMASLDQMKNDIKDMGKTMLKLSISIAIMAASLYMLSKIKDPSSLRNAVLAILAVLIVTMAVVIELSNQMEKVKTGPILGMAALIAAIGLSLTLLTNLGDPSKAILAAVAMGLVIAAIGVFLKELGKINTGMGLGLIASLYSMILMIISIAGALMLLSAVDNIKTLVVSALAIISVLAGVAGSLIALSKYSDKIDATVVEALFLMMFVIMVIAGSIAGLAIFSDGKSLLKPVLAILAVLAGVVISIIAISKLTEGLDLYSLIGFGLAVAALAVIAISLKTLLDGGYNWDKMKEAMKAMLIVLASVVVALSLLAIISAATGNIALVIAGAALVLVLLALSAAMLAFASSVKVISVSLLLLSKIDYDKINTDKLNDLVAVLLKLGVVSYLAAGGAVLLGGGLIIIGAGVLLVSAGFSLLVASITALIKAFASLISKFILIGTLGPLMAKNIKIFSKSIADFITTIIKSVAMGIVQFFKTLSENIDIIAKAITQLIVTIITSIVDAGVEIARSVLESIKKIFAMVEEELPGLLERLNTIIIIILASLAENAPIYGYYGAVIAIGFIAGLINGIAEAAPDLLDSVVWLAISTVKAIKDTLDKYSGVLAQGLEKGYSEFSAKTLDILAFVAGDSNTKLGSYLGDLANEMYENADAVGTNLESDYQQLAEEHANKNSKIFADATANSMDNQDVSKAKNATANKQSEILNQESISKDFASGNIGAYVKETAASAIGMDLSDPSSIIADKTGNMFGASDQAVQEEKEVIYKDIEGMPDEMVRGLQSQGWKMAFGGKQLYRQVTSGMQEESESSGAEKEVTGSLDSIFGIFSEQNSNYTDIAGEGGDNYFTGLHNSLSDPKNLDILTEDGVNLAAAVNSGVTGEWQEKSPSRKARKFADFFIAGLVISLSKGNDSLLKEATTNANTVLDVYNDAINKVSETEFSNNMPERTLKPVITPEIDYSQISKANDYLRVVNNPATMKLAADSTMTVQNSDQQRLAQQIDNLSNQVNKLAEKDLSNAFKDVKFNVNANTSVDGKVLRKTSAEYTIDQIDKKERAIVMAKGGRA